MLRTNEDRLPVISLGGLISYPRFRKGGSVDIDGQVHYVTGTGGIVYNARIGDCCCGWAADHLEPGATSAHPDPEKNSAYNAYSCIGNEAVVISGNACGAKGFVTGKHGGVDHVILYFDSADLLKMDLDDKVKVYGCGQGLELLDYPRVFLRNMSPKLLHRLPMEEKNGKLLVGVSRIVPQCVMGAGIGESNTILGDFDITLHDRELTERHGLNMLRFGDIVAVTDVDGRFGRTWCTGGVLIGVVIHGDSYVSGHGPGVTALMGSVSGELEPFVCGKANLADLLL